MTRIVVEGWRFIPHSWAVVNQSLCLELLNRPEIELYHRDMPYWSDSWRSTEGLFPAIQETRLRALPVPPPDLRGHRVFRIDFPYRFGADPAGTGTFVWGTTEVGLVLDTDISGGQRPGEVLPSTGATIITPSRWSREGYIRSGAPPDKVVVVPCGVDTTLFKPPDPDERAALRKQLGWEGKFVALNISAMTGNKGIVSLLKAVAALTDRFPELWLMLKGMDALYGSEQLARNSFTQLTQEEATKVAARLQYVGHTLSAETMASLYKAADVYISPYHAEGFNLPVMEAAACGLPVICTGGGSTDDFTQPDFVMRIHSKVVLDRNGIRLLDLSLDHLVTLLTQVCADGTFRAQAQKAGPAFINAGFTWKHTVDRLLQVLIHN